MVNTILKYILIANFALFLSLGLSHKIITKVSFFIGILAFILILAKDNLRANLSALKNYLERDSINMAIFSFLLISFTSLCLSDNFNCSQEVFFQRYILYFLFFYMGVFMVKNMDSEKLLIFAYLLGVFFFSIGGFIDFYKKENLERLFTSFGIRRFFAAYFLYALPFLLSFVIFSKSKKEKLTALFISPLIFACFFLHASRATWIALFFSIFFTYTFLTKYRKTGFNLIIFLLSIILIYPQLRSRLFSSNTLSPSTWGDRVLLWEGALKIFEARPFLGAGPGTYESLIYKVIPVDKFTQGKIHIHAHNAYIELLSEVGILGLLAFISIFFLIFKNLFRRIMEKQNFLDIAYAVLFLAILIGELTSTTITTGVYSAAVFWFLLGMAVGRHGEMENA